MSEQQSRRTFLRHAVQLSALGIGAGVVLSACGKSGGGGGAGGACEDLSGLSDADKATRTTFAYVAATPDAKKACDLCQLYKPAAAGAACGGCQVVKGPIDPKGTCNSFAPKA